MLEECVHQGCCYLAPSRNCEVIVLRKGYGMYFTQAGKSCESCLNGDSTPISVGANRTNPDLVAERREVVLVFSREYGMGRGYREAIHQRSLYVDEMTGFS